MKYVRLVMLFALVSPQALIAGEIAQKLDISSGRRLLSIVLAPASEGKDYRVVDQDSNLDKPFIIYQLFSHHHYGSEFYAVNSFTGDIWDTVSCKQLSGPDLLREQAKIKQQFRDDEVKEYGRLHRLRPVNPGLDPC
jgi:hypothetical protein